MAYKWWLLTTCKSWDDPPSKPCQVPEGLLPTVTISLMIASDQMASRNVRGAQWNVTLRKTFLKELGVSKNNCTPQIINFNRVFYYKPSILGYPYFLETPRCFVFFLGGCFFFPLLRKLTWNLKIPLGKGETATKKKGFHVNFRACIMVLYVPFWGDFNHV